MIYETPITLRDYLIVGALFTGVLMDGFLKEYSEQSLKQEYSRQFDQQVQMLDRSRYCVVNDFHYIIDSEKYNSNFEVYEFSDDSEWSSLEPNLGDKIIVMVHGCFSNVDDGYYVRDQQVVSLEDAISPNLFEAGFYNP